jgi:serine protease
VKALAPSFKVEVDTRLRPGSNPLPVFKDKASRPLATLTDKSGKQVDFVENELMVEFATQKELGAFLTQWHGTVLATDYPKTTGVDADPTYLIRVQTERADLSKLSGDLSKLNPKGGSDIAVSSEAARRLIAVGAAAAATGRHVGINYLTKDDSFQDLKLAEAPASPNNLGNDAGMVIESWNPNPSEWIYMKSGGPFDIGVASAWRALAQVGALNHKVKIAVIGGGFGAGDDFPSAYEYNGASLGAYDPTGSNDVECSNDSPCPWHGWNVVNAGMGQVNNGIGAAGPAGPVAKLLAVRRSADIFNNIQALTIALASGANIINMSFGSRIPASLSWSVIPFNLATLRAHGAGKLIFASAGNAGEDINEEDCFIACWESAWWTPCENGGVTCIGAMDGGGPYPSRSSNYGDEELDMWGPGYLWVGGDYGDNSPHVFSATSAASPFVAGVAALIWAANPALDNEKIEGILDDTAHQGSSGQVERWPNAYAAVLRALGGTPPDIVIDVRWEASAQVFGACQPRFLLTAKVTDPDNGPPTVTWRSDIDGVLGNGDSFTRPLSNGIHHITATAVDGIGLTTVSNEVVLTVSNPTNSAAPRPTIDIISLVNHQVFAANQNVTLEASGLDPGEARGGLVATRVRWSSSKDGDLGAGQRIFRTLSPGAHYITASYTGTCGATADDLRLIQVTRAVADASPNMTITTPSGNDLLLRVDASGQACLRVGGFGFDEEDHDFATIEWWETNRTDLQWKVLSFDQNTTVCLKLAANATSSLHEVRLRGRDRTGHVGYSSPLRVNVLPGLR